MGRFCDVSCMDLPYKRLQLTVDQKQLQDHQVAATPHYIALLSPLSSLLTALLILSSLLPLFIDRYLPLLTLLQSDCDSRPPGDDRPRWTRTQHARACVRRAIMLPRAHNDPTPTYVRYPVLVIPITFLVDMIYAIFII